MPSGERELILNPGQSCVLAAVFKPTVAGPASATLSIHTSSGTFNLPLSGNGAALEIALPSAAFGGVAVGTTSPPLSLRVTNYTSAAAAYDEKRGSPSFQVQPGTCRMDDGDQMLAAGASCVFTVGFAPTENGTATGSLVFSTNLGTVDFPMTGSTPVIYSESVLHSFCSLANCADGGNGFEQLPHGPGVIRDAAGNLYGTTPYGGNSSCSYGTGYGLGCGTVFKLDSTGHETVLYNFCSAANCADGELPDAGLIQDAAGNLYGTTFFGGANNSSCFYEGCGTVFKLDNTGHESTLYSFCSVTECTAVAGDGYSPRSALIRDSAGNLYGTTTYGGGPGSCPFANNGCGTVFRVDSTGNEAVLYSFCSVAACPNGAGDGYSPESGLVQDADGNLYGTTEFGGATNSGAVFKVDSTGNETVLYSFCSAAYCGDGSQPYAGLIRDAAGNLYGTTTAGGVNGGGTVFKLDSMGRETVLYNFCSVLNCADGNSPYAGLIRDAAGYLYGTTLGDGVIGAGTAFSVDSTGHETVLYGFCSVAQCADGAFPAAGLVKDAAGNLYGTTSSGGANGQGVVFKLTPQFN